MIYVKKGLEFSERIKTLEEIARLSVDGMHVSTSFYDPSGELLVNTLNKHDEQLITSIRQTDGDMRLRIRYAGMKSHESKKPYLHHYGTLWHVASAIGEDNHEYTLYLGPFINQNEPILQADVDEFCKNTGIAENQVGEWMNSLVNLDPATVVDYSRTLTDLTGKILRQIEIQKRLMVKLEDQQDQIKRLLHDKKINAQTIDHIEKESRYRRFSYAFEKEYISHIQIGNRENANRMINEVLDEIFAEAKKEPERLKANVFEFFAFLARSAIANGVPDKALANAIEKSHRMMKSDASYDDICILISEAINDLNDAVYRHKGNKGGGSHLTTAILYIRNNYQKKMVLADVAEKCGISEYYLSHLFRDEMDMTFVDYVNKIRLDEAKKMLQNVENTIYQVALDCGFKDPNYFSKAFKKYVGITPGKYQKLFSD